MSPTAAGGCAANCRMEQEWDQTPAACRLARPDAPLLLEQVDGGQRQVEAGPLEAVAADELAVALRSLELPVPELGGVRRQGAGRRR